MENSNQAINNIGDQKRSKVNIIQALRLNGPTSRIELTRITGLSRATVTFAIGDLMESGLVRETQSRYSTGGRPATLLELVHDAKAIVGADYNNKLWNVGAFDLIGNVIDEIVIPVEQETTVAVVQSLTTRLMEFVQRLDIPPLELIGLGMPGLIDANYGIINSAADLGWAQVDIKKMIESQINWPTVVINRHRARGIAESRYGVGRDYNEIIYIGVGTGIASGLFHQRKLISGSIGGAGELGHITVEPNGLACPCGNRGCLQQLATGPAMEQDARILLRSGRTSSIRPDSNFDLQLIKAIDICQAADEHDELCMEIVKKAATYMGIAMANLVNILNPQIIILGGNIPAHCNYYLEIAEEVMHQRAMSPLTSNIVVTRASQTKMGGALGAANFALDQNMGYSLFL